MKHRLTRSVAERAQTERLESYYVDAQSDVLRAIEQSVCGCHYGGCSWTTRAEADRFVRLMQLEPGRRLLDVGAGSGWPGLYMADASGCDVTLTDLPLSGLRIAAERADRDALPGACWAVVSDGAGLPFIDGSFDAISHSDVLCCLAEKRAVLAECRRVLRQDGTMVFSVISIAPGLNEADYRRAVECGPEFIEADAAYAVLLEETGWRIKRVLDVSAEFVDSCRRMRGAETAHAEALCELLGAAAYAERRANLELRHAGASAGFIRREMFVASKV